MYLQITTRCNMHCAHCCYSCTAMGEDMSLDTFRNALDNGDGMISLGGGEPTIHPLFWQFLGEALAACDEYLWLATNGKETRTALALAKLAKRGVIGCALSQDAYHSPIDPGVVAAFTVTRQPLNVGYREGNVHDGRDIRNVTGKEIKMGRCRDGKIDCCCEDIIVKPDGSVHACGCEKSPCFGNVNSGYTIPDEWEYGTCYRDQPKLPRLSYFLLA